MYLESVTHNDNLEKFIVTKGNQPQGKVGGTVQIIHWVKGGNCTNHPQGKGGKLYRESDDTWFKGFNNHTLSQDSFIQDKTFMVLIPLKLFQAADGAI